MRDLQANMDFLGRDSAQGDVAQRLMTQGRLDVGRMRPWINPEDGRTYVTVYKGGDPKKGESYEALQINTTGTLRRDEWKQLDDAVLAASRYRLGGIQDLKDKGLVYNLGNAMATTVLEYHDVSDGMEADMTMDGVSRGRGDRPVYGVNYLPLPIIHVDFEINARVLAASRNFGNPLDTTEVEQGTRRILEKLETMLFTSTSYYYGGGTIYGYLNQSNRNTISLGAHWDHSGTTGANILGRVLAAKAASIADYHFGPWMLYIPSAYETAMEQDYVTGYPKSIRARLKEVEGILDVKTVDTLTADNVLLVQMTNDVVRLVQGMGIQIVEWSTEGGMVTKYKLMTIQVPQVRNDQNSRSGIIHMS
jgi:hypothetical protein